MARVRSKRSYPEFDVSRFIGRQHASVIESDIGKELALDRLDLWAKFG